MIVYGDPQYEASLHAFLAQLGSRLGALRSGESPTPLLDELRALLIQAGQLEQAVQDGLQNGVLTLSLDNAQRGVAVCQQLTNGAAVAFVAEWAREQQDIAVPQEDVADSLLRMDEMLRHIQLPNARLTFKLPEGFALYALYPEQYCAAALRWLTEHADVSRVVVVGIRSIGTSLSAVVMATLKARGCHVHRLTVRPQGHPFERQTQIAATELEGADWGLIVDEGPGFSGSSMSAVAEALVHAGVASDHLSFFPGHSGEPGSAASQNTREWWYKTPRFVVPGSTLRWHGRSLPELLADHTSHLCGVQEIVERTEDLGGGLWRQTVYAHAEMWPPVAAPFERPKYRCVLRDGSAVLWKFGGLASLADGRASAAATLHAMLTQRAEAGWTPPSLGVVSGFVATRWIEGNALTRDDVTDAFLEHMGRYITEVAGTPLSQSEQESALQRLQEMLFWNTHEALGEISAKRAELWSEEARDWEQEHDLPTCGDGNLTPHTWLRTPDGRILKTSSVGHAWDHTVVGRQSFVWDVAGAIIEWGLDEVTAAPLLGAVSESGLTVVPSAILRFYCMAYAAFRMGQFSLCQSMVASDSAEHERLRQGCDFYRDALTRLLES